MVVIKRAVGIFILLILAAALAACTDDQDTESGAGLSRMSSIETSKESEPITLRMTYWASSQLTVDKNDAVIRLFEETYPNIRIKAEYFWGDAYSGSLAVMAASNSLPDVIRIDYSNISRYIDKGLLLPLNEYIDSGAIDLEGVSPMHNDGATKKGKTYALNIGNNALVMFYNPALLAKAGVAAPGPDYTWEQYEEDLRALKQVGGVYGDTHLTFNHFQIWLRQHGLTLYNEKQDGLGYDDDGLFTTFFQRQLRLQQEELTTPTALEQNVRGLDDGPFPRGLSAFGGLSYWSNHIDIMEKQLGFPVGLAMYPGSGEGGMYIKPSFYHGIASTSKHPDEAALFINFYTNNMEAAKSLNGYFGLPYHPRVIEGIKDSLSETQRNVLAYLTLVERKGNPIDPPQPSVGGEVSSLYSSLHNEILFGRITPEEGATRFRNEATVILKRGAVESYNN
jgi:multiple sugar transport system substrate-binding protein